MVAVHRPVTILLVATTVCVVLDTLWLQINMAVMVSNVKI